MTAQEQVRVIQRREKALFDMEKSLFNIGTNKHGGSIKMVDNFYGRHKKTDELETKEGINNG